MILFLFWVVLCRGSFKKNKGKRLEREKLVDDNIGILFKEL